MRLLGVHKRKGYGNKIPSDRPRGGALLPGAAHVSACPAPRAPPHPDPAGSSNARESPVGFHVCHVPKYRDGLESRKWLALSGACDAPELPQVCRGREGNTARYRPLHRGSCDWLVSASLILLWVRRGRSGAWPGVGEQRALAAGEGGRSQVLCARGPGTRSPHAGESPRRHGWRCRNRGGAAAAAARTCSSVCHHQLPPCAPCVPGALRKPPGPRQPSWSA